MNSTNIRNKLFVSMILGIVVFAGLLAYGDFTSVGSHVREFRWELMPLILAVTLGNYGLRFLKWQYYLKQIQVRGLTKLDSFLIYFSGLGMTVTPGKVGEWLKSHLLREVHGTPVARSTPILLAERLTDSLGLLIIAGAGAIVFGRYLWVAALVAGAAVVVIGVSRHRRASYGILRVLSRVPLIRRLEPHFEELYESTYILLQPRAVVLMTALSVISWFCEVLAFYLTLIGLGVDGSLDTLFKAAFILPIATLVAAAVPTPGGLGTAEAIIAKLSQELIDGLAKSPAVLGTLIVRIATLWFGVVLGLIAFAVLTRKLAREGRPLAPSTNEPIAVGES